VSLSGVKSRGGNINMNWKSIQKHYPSQWVLAEAVEARSEGGKRILSQLAVLDTYPDSLSAMRSYKMFHKKCPGREFYVLHTDRRELSVEERRWVGIRGIR